ncbi:MAG: MFS transporter [Cyclobacteriaceae bacterium]|nr:MFS transporter [Cyclobacteriaceae bacterium]
MNFPRIAVKIVFFLNGFVHANLYSRLPRVQEQFNLDNGSLGFVLLASSIGAIGAMPFTGWFIIRYGSRKITLFSVFFYCLLVPLVPWAFSFIGLIALFFLMGVSAGMLDVSMNAQAVMVEQRHGKPIMTSFHALFSIGMMMGAATGSLFSKMQSGLFTHLGIITIISVLISFIVRYYLIHDKPVSKQEGPAFRIPNSAMVSIGIIAFCCMLGEGAMADWSTNYLENISQADKALAPIGLAAFAMAMTIGRLLGDRARIQFGDRKLIIICGLIASTGLSISIAITEPWMVIAGFFLVGIGLSVIVPIAYSIGGNTQDLPPGVGLAMVTTVGYAGFLFGPPIIGFLADWQSLRFAFLLVLILFLLMIALSARYTKT